MESSTWWSELTDDLKVEALSWLPEESLCRYHAVCKEWNALFSSTKFITNDWQLAPWLLVYYRRFSPVEHKHLMAYCFCTNTWKRLSLAYLEKKCDQLNAYKIVIRGSAAGLLLLSIYGYGLNDTSHRVSHTVSNPLTGTFLELPIENNTLIYDMTIVAGEGETYKVIALAAEESERDPAVIIYDSFFKSWTVEYIPEDLRLFGKRLVISKDFMYCYGSMSCTYLGFPSSKHGIIAFNILNGAFSFRPLPSIQNVDPYDRNDFLFSSGSRVFLATCMYDGIIIWEFGKPGSNNPKYREITRTPPSLWEDFRRKEDIPPGILRLNGFDFQGISDLVCITYAKVKQLLVYNLNENIWRWFGRREIEEHERTDMDNPIISTFHPRLHMKVE